MSQFDSATTSLIEEHVRRLLIAIGLEDADIRCLADNQDSLLRINIEAGDEGRMLIGARGSHLIAVQHLIRCVMRRQLKERVNIVVDINGYRARREQSLLNMAEEVARKAHRTGRAVVLDPMSAADRRAVHTALSAHKDIQTESLGEEPNRRVIIRPVFL